MKSNFGEAKKRIAIYCFCGAIMAPTLTSFVCLNRACPDYLLEKHEHLPEQKQGVHNHFENITYVSSVAASGVSTSTTTTLPMEYYMGTNNKGGES
jgi:hypothetical protein